MTTFFLCFTFDGCGNTTTIIQPTEQSSCPELIFTDPEFAFELRRTLSAAYAGEADLGECLYTASIYVF